MQLLAALFHSHSQPQRIAEGTTPTRYLITERAKLDGLLMDSSRTPSAKQRDQERQQARRFKRQQAS